MDQSVSSEFVHVFHPGDPAKPTLLLLHGTGGDEHNLVPLGRHLLPDATILSPRGQVLEHGMPRFFRRFAEGVLDVDDLKARAASLANWVTERLDATGAPRRVLAVGFSNGANIAAGILLAHPGVLAGAVLFRPMVPYEPARLPSLSGTPVLIAAGSQDPIVRASHVDRLAELLKQVGANVSLSWQEAGHGLVQGDIDAAMAFIAQMESN